MVLKKIFGAAFGILATGSALSGTAFAAAGDFNFTATLSQAAGSTTAITASKIDSSDPANYINYTNGTDSGQIDNASGFGTAIVLASYTTTAADPSAGVASNYADLISFTDLTTGATQMQSLTGSYGGEVGNNATNVTQSFNQTALTFTFADGTYVINGFGHVSSGAPGGTSGSTGASVVFTSTAAPEPSALALIVPGVLGMVAFARRRKPSK